MAKVNLKAARVNAGFTQKEAAEKLNVSNATLCNWENGTSYPNIQQVESLCDLYGLTYDDINFLPTNPIKTDGKE